jgi:hypothetical protein
MRLSSLAQFPERCVLIVSVTAAICASACTDAGSGKRVRSRFRVTPAAGIIMPPETGPAVIGQCTRAVPQHVTAYWTLERKDVDQLEYDLPELFARIARDLHNEPSVTDMYYRQYVGIISEGRKLVYINGFRRSYVHPYLRLADTLSGKEARRDSISWRNRPVSVCDGGTAFFGVVYDLNTRTFGPVQFNLRI